LIDCLARQGGREEEDIIINTPPSIVLKNNQSLIKIMEETPLLGKNDKTKHMLTRYNYYYYYYYY